MESETKNWPPFYPIVHYELAGEVPSESLGLAKKSFFIWQLTLGAYLANFITDLLLIFSGENGYGLKGTIVSAICLVIFPILAFLSWHMALYKALKYDSSFWYIFYFCSFGIQLGIFALLAIGILGNGGIIGTFDLFSNARFLSGSISAISTAVLCGCLFFGFYLIQAVVRHFRSGGHSIERAGKEAGHNISSNPNVRSTAKEHIINNMA